MIILCNDIVNVAKCLVGLFSLGFSCEIDNKFHKPY